MENEEKTTFSLDDADDEVVEESVIERDEEYDDDDDEEEDYGDEEEYDDEDYGDEEEYDDGYNDDYYDERLNKVLDEIAEIKRGMQAPSTVVQQQPYTQPPMPQYIYQPSAPPAGSEVVMYNEISRLRDELAKNQSSLEMQKELTRIKDDMARDQKFAESQYSAEIKRLQDKIEDLQKNASSPQSEQLPPPQAVEQGRIEGTDVKSIDFEKLLSINEAILRATRDSDARMHGEISQLRKQVEEFPSMDELNRLVSSAKKAAGTSDGNCSELINRLSTEVASLRSALQNAGAAPASVSSATTPIVIHDGGSGDISTSELLRQLYDIKNAIGSSSIAAAKRAQVISELIGDYKKVNYDAHSQSVPFKDKLASINAFAKKLEECNEPDAVDLIQAVNSISEELASTNITRDMFSDIISYASEKGESIPSSVRDGADRYFNISEKIADASLDECVDYLPDLIAEKNILQKNSAEDANNELFTDIMNALTEDPRDEDAIKDMIGKLAEIKVSDLVELPLVAEPKSYKAARTVNDENIFGKLAEIKAAIVDAGNARSAKDDAAEDDVEDYDRDEEDVRDDDSLALQTVLDAVDDLRATLQENTGAQDISGALEEIRSNYLDILDRLVEISDKQAEAPVGEGVAAAAEPVSDEDKERALEDLNYIRTKLDDYELFINQIGDLRSDILNISSTIDLTEQFNSIITEITNQTNEIVTAVANQTESLLSELTSQSDKLYEDLSSALIDSETNILNRISETSAADAINDAKTEILADTQALRDAIASINDSVVSVTDTVVTLPVNDAVEQLRADVLNLSDQVTLNADAALTDRQKILDDISYLREQAELAISEKDEAGAESDDKALEEEREKLYGYLDDITLRLEQLGTVPEDITAVKDSVTTLVDAVMPISDNVLTVGDNVIAARDAANAALEALAPISDRINEIIERLDAEEQQATEESIVAEDDADQPDLLDEDIVEIKDDLNTILDTLPLLPQSDDLVTARDNTYSILDTLTMMPQSDDVVTTRDNVAAILDAVSALTESIQNIASGDIAEDVAAIKAAIPEGFAEDLAVVRDNTSTMLDSLATLTQSQEDIQYIRQKLEEEPEADGAEDSINNIMQDLGLVLDKLEALEQNAANNKQEIVDTVSDIRESIHINELDESITAAGIDDETREVLVGEIAEIRERLNNIDSNIAAIDGISNRLADLQAVLATVDPDRDNAMLQTLNDVNDKLNSVIDGLQSNESIDGLAADIADIKAALAGGAVAQGDGDGVPVVSDEKLQAIIDELSVIKEKIDTESDYDTVEEILTLRDDVKAARIVDQNEVSGELEAIKNELAAISSGNILDEIRALRDEVAAISGSAADSESAPTDGELNLVLNEIVSLRDEVFAFKDEVMSARSESGEQTDELQDGDSSDDLNNILDELSDLREAQGALTDCIEDLKDAISRRTTIAADSESATAESASASNELNIVLDEIINIKNDIDGINERIVTPESIDALTQQLDGSAADMASLAEQIENVNNAINDLRLSSATDSLAVEENGEVAGSIVDNINGLRADIADIRAALSSAGAPDYGNEIAELRAEIENLRAENEALRQEQNNNIQNELADLREAVHDMALAVTPVQTAAGDTSYAVLIDEIKGLKEQIVSAANVQTTATLDDDTIRAIRDALTANASNAPLTEELGEIRDEIAQLRSLTTVTAESGSAAEIAAIKNELQDLRESIVSSDNMYGLAEDVTAIKADIQTIKEEPDLGVINEILALRDEFQSLREEIEDVKRVAGETDKQADDQLLNEVQSLRDQLFAISMANVNDSASGETNYESYNNLILDELGNLREQVESAGSTEDIKSLFSELNQLKKSIDKRDELYDELAERVAKLNSDATNNKILEELGVLRTELANQRDADLTTLNFMSEMAHLLERQNSYITQNAGTKITDEIESLKAEIASSDAVAEEVAKLREIMTKSGNASDNNTILGELADLREELSSEKPSRENELILQEIARLRDEIVQLAEHDHSDKNDVAATDTATASQTDSDLADSLSDLKDQLNEIAGIVEPAKKPTQRKKSAGTKKTAGQKSKSTGTGAKKSTGKKPAQKRNTQRKSTVVETETVIEQPEVSDDLEAKIDEQMSGFGGGDMSLNPNATELSTGDAMDVADRLAQQVANKLVIEQLVEQLGDGGLSEEQVEDILSELPQELTTTALNESSEKVRKFANQLVLNKLRERLNGKDNNNN